MTLDVELFQAIQDVLPKVFEQEGKPLNMRKARPLVIKALAGRGFTEEDLWREVYRHIHYSCLNETKRRRAYQGVSKILWNEKDGTFRLLKTQELSEIALGRTPDFVRAAGGPNQQTSSEAKAFAREALLRDHLAKDLSSLETGLTFWETDPPSKEYFLGSRRVDICAKDQTGCPVIIELKLHRAHDRVIGQALLYRALMRRRYVSLKRVRIILVAEHISEELILAAEELSDVAMYECEYKITMPEGTTSIRYTKK